MIYHVIQYYNIRYLNFITCIFVRIKSFYSFQIRVGLFNQIIGKYLYWNQSPGNLLLKFYKKRRHQTRANFQYATPFKRNYKYFKNFVVKNDSRIIKIPNIGWYSYIDGYTKHPSVREGLLRTRNTNFKMISLKNVTKRNIP